VVTVRARDAQHRSIKTLLDKIVISAQRQVLIEATVVEVTLNDKFESGVDWQVLNSDGESGANFDFSHLSSPKIIAMNNQPAVLKVVDNRVYFTFEVNRLERENGDERTVVDSTVHSVPVGLVMNVTPFISKDKEVILNVRPTISRILNFAEDPSPALAGQSQVRNLIPEIQVREMESLLRVQSGNVAIIGGLMQNKVDNRTTVVPGLGSVPVLGKLFSHETREIEKTELLIFLRPTVIDNSGNKIIKGGVVDRNRNKVPTLRRVLQVLNFPVVKMNLKQNIHFTVRVTGSVFLGKLIHCFILLVVYR